MLFRSVVQAFGPGTAGGLDSMRPQVLKDVLAFQVGDAGTINKCRSGRDLNRKESIAITCAICGNGKSIQKYSLVS